MGESKRKFLLLYGLKVGTAACVLFLLPLFILFLVFSPANQGDAIFAETQVISPDTLDVLYFRREEKGKKWVETVTFKNLNGLKQNLSFSQYKDLYFLIKGIKSLPKEKAFDTFGAPLLEIEVESGASHGKELKGIDVFSFLLQVGGINQEEGNLFRIEIDPKEERRKGKQEFIYFKKKGILKQMEEILKGAANEKK